MFVEVLNRFQNWLISYWPTQVIEHNSEERHKVSKKRPGDFLHSEKGKSFPNKKICLEKNCPVDTRLHQALPLVSNDFLNPDFREIHHIPIQSEIKLSTTYCITHTMDSKSYGASYSSQSPNHENENVMEISDEGQAAHRFTNHSMKTRTDRACWSITEPKHNPTTKSFQCFKCREKNKLYLNDNFRSASKSPDSFSGRRLWTGYDRPSSMLGPHNPFASVKPPVINQTKRYDNKVFYPPIPPVVRGILETRRLEKKNYRPQCLKPHFDVKAHLTGGFQNTSTKLNGLFDNKLTMVIRETKTKSEVEYFDFTKMNETVPMVRRNQDKKTQTLASKLANVTAEIASTSRPENQTQANHFEKMELESCSKRRPQDDKLTSSEVKNCDIRETLKESQLHAKQYAQHNNEVDNKSHTKDTASNVVCNDILEDKVPKLPTLLPSMQEAIDKALRPDPPHQTLIKKFSINITRHDIKTLADKNCLNDAVINFYMNLLQERGKRESFPSVYAFNTFFYTNLESNGFVTLKRWTRRTDLFSYDLIIVPVHLTNHWCMAAIDFRDKTIRYFNSMGASNNQCLNVLLEYLQEESMDKKETPYDTTSWKKINVKDIPQQMNLCDCGVFACIYSEYICRNAKISFTQADIPYFRRKMIFEILSGRLLDLN